MDITDAEIESKLHAILARPMYHRDDLDAWLRVLKRYWQQLSDYLSTLPLWAMVMTLAFCALALLALGVAMWGMRESVRRSLGRSPGQPTRMGPTAETANSPGALLDLAQSLAGSGNLREAGRALQQAVLVKLCHERGIAWKPTLADWEWLTILRPDKDVVVFTQRVQLLAYGPAATLGLYEACKQQAVALLMTPRTTL